MVSRLQEFWFQSVQPQERQPLSVEFCLADRESMHTPLRNPCDALWVIMAEDSEVSGGEYQHGADMGAFLSCQLIQQHLQLCVFMPLFVGA